MIGDYPLARKVNVDVGRVHYNRWVYVGGTGPDVARAYSDVPVRSTLKRGGCAWFVGAGGPMGRMHVQRAIQVPDGPAVIVCTDVSDLRLYDLRESYGEEAAAEGIEFICLNPMNKDAYAEGMARFKLIPPPKRKVGRVRLRRYHRPGACSGPDRRRSQPGWPPRRDERLRRRRPRHHGAAGSERRVSETDARHRPLRIEHRGPAFHVLPGRDRHAVAQSLGRGDRLAGAARDGMQALMDTTYPGKVVIYPHIKELPLTGMADLKVRLPSVYAMLKDGREWTNEAEAEFLRLMLECADCSA